MSIFHKENKIVHTLSQRRDKLKLPGGGNWSIQFSDGSEACEKDYSWDAIAEYGIVDYMGQTRMVKLSKYPIKSITVTHKKSTTTLMLKEGEQVYTSIRSIANPTDNKKHKILGRVVGIVKDGKVIREHFCDGVNVLGVSL